MAECWFEDHAAEIELTGRCGWCGTVDDPLDDATVVGTVGPTVYRTADLTPRHATPPEEYAA